METADRPLPLLPEEAACIQRAVEVRKREFTAGRSCARSALAELGIHGHPLLVAEGRAPVWPPGIVGSITHCDGFAAAAVARRWEILGVGIDAEPRVPLDEKLHCLICTPAEREWLHSASGTSLPYATLIFSAKEVVHKCIHPLSGTMLDFREVEITVDPTSRRFAAKYIGPNGRRLPDLRRLRGRFVAHGRYLVAGAVLT